MWASSPYASGVRAECAAVVAAVLLGISCLGDPAGPSGQLRLSRLEPREAGDSQLLGTPGQPLAAPVVFRATDVAGRPLPGASVHWSVMGKNAAVQEASGLTDEGGLLRAVWVLGTDAREQQRLNVEVRTTRASGHATVAGIAKPTQVAVVRFATDTLVLRLGMTVQPEVSAIDPYGNEFVPSDVKLVSSDTSVVVVDDSGRLTALHRGLSSLDASSGGVGAAEWARVIQVVQSMAVAPETLQFNAIGQVRRLRVVLVDDQGHQVADSLPLYSVADSGVVKVSPDSGLKVQSLKEGATAIRLQVGDVVLDVPALVRQRVASVQLSADTVRFDALGDTVQVGAALRDSMGVPVAGDTARFVSSDSEVVQVGPNGSLRALRNGSALVVARASSGVADTALVTVNAVPTAVEAGLTDSSLIVDLPLDGAVPVVCKVRDRNGNVIDTAPSVVASSGGRWAGKTCGTLRARRSGFDTIVVQAGAIQVEVPITLAIRPMVSSPLGEDLQVDSLPRLSSPWATTARRNSRGEIEIYFAAYVYDTTVKQIRSDLHRLVSSDGVQFHYDGVVLGHDADPCAPQGSGIENVSIVPRSDGPGWRMFYAAGSFDCYGWQVFSAVSEDERTWMKEPGVRLSNGGTLPPDAPVPSPWPVGEGMVTEQLGSGEWRMLVGSYEQVSGREDKFQITEWHSADQLNWTYIGPSLTTREMPVQAQGTIYSPTTRQIAPGLWRMVFNGDDRFQPGWRGRIWSAVSTDRQTWQLEGELMDDPGTRLWYSTLVDDRLIFIREDAGGVRRLAIATVTMP